MWSVSIPDHFIHKRCWRTRRKRVTNTKSKYMYVVRKVMRVYLLSLTINSFKQIYIYYMYFPLKILQSKDSENLIQNAFALQLFLGIHWTWNKFMWYFELNISPVLYLNQGLNSNIHDNFGWLGYYFHIQWSERCMEYDFM
jgi:hypothetical protein